MKLFLVEKKFYEQQKCHLPIYWGHKGNFHSLAFILNPKLPMELKLYGLRNEIGKMMTGNKGDLIMWQ